MSDGESEEVGQLHDQQPTPTCSSRQLLMLVNRGNREVGAATIKSTGYCEQCSCCPSSAPQQEQGDLGLYLLQLAQTFCGGSEQAIDRGAASAALLLAAMVLVARTPSLPCQEGSGEPAFLVRKAFSS